MISLPQEFITRMCRQLGEEINDFLEGYQQEKAYGLRFNPLKPISSWSVLEEVACNGKNEYPSFNHVPVLGANEGTLPFSLTPIPWTREGFYALKEEHPGRHPLHEAGAYYIQEPSAMAVVSLLEPHPGDRICDLCAAPGGKTTDIAGKMDGRGLLISNEIISSRARILSQNVERFGITNTLVTNEPPDKLAERFPLFFDKIVVDAPCSGEGMFRKDDTAIQEWSPEQVERCKERQRMILDCADRMLGPDGVLVYSTCTFAPEEDEDMIGWFLSAHPDYIVEDWREILPEGVGLEGGRREYLLSEYQEEISEQIKNTLRLWPHKLRGEGHFAARLRKAGGSNAVSHIASGTEKGLERETGRKPAKKLGKKGGNPKNRKAIKRTEELEDYQKFCRQFLKGFSVAGEKDVIIEKVAAMEKGVTMQKSVVRGKVLSMEGNYQYLGDELYVLPDWLPELEGLRILRAGLHLGTQKKNRFEPAHALAMALSPADVVQCQDCDEALALRYLHGETIPCDAGLHSWTLVSCQGVSMGWGKAQNGVLKNHYPKGLRIQGDMH